MSTILLVDDLKTIREQFAYDLQRKTDWEIITAANGREALDMLADREADVVILDLEMPVMDGLQALETMTTQGFSDIPVIVYTGAGSYERCVKAVQLGAYNFFDKDEVSIEQLIRAIENALEHRQLKQENQALRRAARQDSPIIGESLAIRELRSHIKKVAQIPSNVLILGESGTGKELVARELHSHSPRSKRPFVAVNCAAIPENLVESELFGYERGAFSGAAKTTKGKFEVATGGTLFLDEIGDMPYSVQAKLLRVLQEGEMTRLGGEGRVIKIDVRVVTATHRDLETLVAEEIFRRDLYYRICTHMVRVPALRERLEDVGPLTLFFMERICERFGSPQKLIARETIQILQAYDWRQNNVRELENIVERMIIRCDGPQLLPEHVPPDIRESVVAPEVTPEKTLPELKAEAEHQIILRALQNNEWHISNTARALGLSNHSNLLKIMRRLGIKRPG